MAAKSDMERIGLFKEMSYLPASGSNINPSTVTIREIKKGRQIMSHCTQSRAANDDGYFAVFTRAFEGEAYNNYSKMGRRNFDKSKHLKGAWVPVVASKKPSGINSYFGTFSGPIDAMKGELRKKPKEPHSKRNAMTNPGKKGSGYGYMDVTIGPYPEYMPCPMMSIGQLIRLASDEHKKRCLGRPPFYHQITCPDFFDLNPYASMAGASLTRPTKPLKPLAKPFIPSHPSKLDGGMHDGTFSQFPTFQPEPYQNPWFFYTKDVVNKSGKKFIPGPSTPGIKSCPTTSIVNQNVTKFVNNLNYNTVKHVMKY